MAGGGIAAVSERRFDGDVVVIDTARGFKLTCTPNHPILTPSGWVSAGSLNVGEYVISCQQGNWKLLGDVDNENMPTRIHDIAEAFRRAPQMIARPVPMSAEDFHGDGTDGQIAVIWADGELGDELDSHVGQKSAELLFVGAHSPNRLSADGLATEGIEGFLDSPRGIMRWTDLSSPLAGRHSRPLEKFSIALAARLDTSIKQYAANGGPTNTEFIGNALLRYSTIVEANDLVAIEGQSIISTLPDYLDTAFPKLTSNAVATVEAVGFGDLGARLASLVAPDKIIEVKVKAFSGHVFNLQTEMEWYVAEGIITHNCRCRLVPSAP